MRFDLNEALELLANTPRVLNAMLIGVSTPWVHNNYGTDTFSPFDVVGHLIHGERVDWLVRARIILEQGEDRPFDPFDRYAMYEQSKGKSIEELLETFADLRATNVLALQDLKLTPEHLKRTGTHPELGRVTLEQLLSTWVVHDQNHIHQIAKSMAWQYRENIGPWRAYVPLIG